MSTPIRIAILGAAGRMGRALIATVAATPGAQLSAALDRDNAPELGADAVFACADYELEHGTAPAMLRNTGRT